MSNINNKFLSFHRRNLWRLMIPFACFIIVLSFLFLNSVHSSAEKRPPELTHKAWRQKIKKELDIIFLNEVNNYSISLRDVFSGFYLDVRAHRRYPAASTMKIGVMLALYSLAQRKQISLNQRIKVRNSFKSIIDGSSYKVPKEYSKKCRCISFKKLNRKLTMRTLNKDMIRSSSNLAANLLINFMGVRLIHQELQRLGIRELTITRGLYDMKAFNKNKHNTISAHAAMKSFNILSNYRYFTRKFQKKMIKILSKTEHRDKIPALLPQNIIVANKSGYTDDESHDAALVFATYNKPYAIAILTSGHRDKVFLEEKIAEASRMIYDSIIVIRQLKRAR